MDSHRALSLSGAAREGCGLANGELERLLEVARQAARAGAEPLRRLFGQLEHIRAKGEAGNLVTEADLAAESAVLAVLEQQTPHFPVLAEESGRRNGQGDLEWCVDPLDGTTNYAHGFPVFATSVGLLWRGRPLLGALELPAMEQSFWASAGSGAWRNDSRLQVSACERVEDALLATGFAYDRTRRRDNNYAEFAHFTHRSHGVRRAGAAAVDLAWVSAGCLDGYWERGLSPWDLAAAVVLVEEAGGVVSAYDGSPLRLEDGRLIACAPALHGVMVETLASLQPLAGASYGAPDLDQAAAGVRPPTAP